MNQLIKKRAIITGGNKGIGKAVAIEFARNGADIVLCDIEENPATATELRKFGTAVLSVQCDVSDPVQVESAAQKAREFLGGIDILANIAGISPKGPDGFKIPFYDLTTEQWDRVINVNLNSMFYFSRAVARDMMNQRYGRIINMSSMVGLTASEHGPAAACYRVAKTGVVGLTRTMAYELAEYDITVNAAAPGRIKTEMSDSNNEYYNKLHMDLIPMKRFGTPEEVADLFVFLASDQSKYITGVTVNISGGWFL